VPVAITRHGDTIGYYIPARRKRSETERTALKEAAIRLQQALASEGISEEEIFDDFKQWRADRRSGFLWQRCRCLDHGQGRVVSPLNRKKKQNALPSKQGPAIVLPL